MQRQNETDEEKKERLAEQKRKREEREEKKKQNEDKSNDCAKQKKETKPKFVSEDSIIMDSADSIVVPKKPKRSSKIKYYDCPIPHDRHLYALERCNINDVFKNIILKCQVDESKLFIIQGPPGTGKTTSLLSYVKSCPQDKRLLFCACTNVGAADIYTRLVMSGYDKSASLVLPPDKIPSSTIMMSDDPKRRIVCTTVSGRNGSKLDNEEFHHVYLDEAGMIMEAQCWGLFREELEFFVMAGDVQQLSALTSESGAVLKHNRSLMERLIENGYPYKFLSAQKRMHPEISKFPNEYFYKGKLSDSVLKEDVKNPYVFVNIDSCTCQESNSFYNSIEAEKAIEYALTLKKEYKNVVILSPYKLQCKYLLSYKSGIPIHTIDSYQGKEADAVVLTLVRTGSDTGFWSNPKRLVVALTRAKNKFCIVGNGASFKKGPLADLFHNATIRKMVVNI